MRSNPLAIADAGGTLAIFAAIYRPKSVNPIMVLIKWSGLLLGLTLALLSGSRGQVLASVAIIAVFLPFATGTKSALRVAGSTLVVGLAVVFMVYVFQTFVVTAAQSRFTVECSAEGLGQRLEMSLTLLDAYATHPAYWPVGLGAASFNEYYPIRAPDNPHWYPHNILVEAIAEYGIPGIVLTLLILYMTARDVYFLCRAYATDRTARSAVVAFGATTAFHFLMSLKQGSMLGMPALFMFCGILGRVARNERLAMQWGEAQHVNDWDEQPAEEYGELPAADGASEGHPRPVVATPA